MSEVARLARFKHLPYRPARKGTPGEGIYLSLWQSFASEHPEALFQIFNSPCCNITQTTFRAAASWMVWMGTNCGLAFTTEAERLASRMGGDRERAFVAHWAWENRRASYINGGLRYIEAVLSQHGNLHDGPSSPYTNWKNVPHVDMDATDAVDAMVRWWSGDMAAEMRSIAEPLISAAQQRQRSEWFRVAHDAEELRHG